MFQVHELVGDYCIAGGDGGKRFDRIFPELRKARQVRLDFVGVRKLEDASD